MILDKKTFVIVGITFFELVFTIKNLIFPTFILVFCICLRVCGWGVRGGISTIKMWKNKNCERARE